MDRSRRVLVVRPDHLGDVLLTLPALVALRQWVPDVHLTYLVAPSVVEAVRRCPVVDAAAAFPFPPIEAPPAPATWQETVARLAPGLRSSFDLALVLRPDDPWSGTLVQAAGVPTRIGYAMLRTCPFLTTALSVVPGRHATEEALAVCRAAAVALGAEGVEGSPAPGPLVVPTAADEDEARAALAALGPGPGARPVVLHPGSGWRLKNWPPERWGQLAAALAELWGLAPLVVGGPGERALVETVVNVSGGRALGLAGRLSLGGLAALHRQARLVVGTDAGPLHLAALVGAPVVGLYGPVGPEQFGPWCPPDRRRLVWRPLPCSPCGTLVDPPCGAVVEPACVLALEVNAVLAAAAELLTHR